MPDFIARVFAVDPGLNGAWAVLSMNGEFMDAGEVPRFDNLVNGIEFANILRTYQPKHFVIERVSAMPKQGVVSTFTFAQASGMLLGVACGFGLPMTRISPSHWKKHFRLWGQPKDAARERAIQLYPKAAPYLNLKKHHGRADALLLARFFLDTMVV